MITKVSTVNMSHEEWLERRKHTIGGSDAAAIVGLNPYSSQYSLFAEKTGRIPGFGGNLATEVGAFLEEFVAKKFEQETGKKVRRENAFIYNDEYPWAHANVDRVICGESALLEIKTTDSLNMKKFKNGEYPTNYYCQAVHYLSVTGKERCYLAVLIGNKDFMWFTIERDEAEIAALMDAEREFWELVKTDTPPAVDGARATTAAVSAIYADSEDDIRCDLYSYQSYLEEFTELNGQIKELESRRDECANHVKTFMGEAGGGECEKFRVSWKTQTRRTFDQKRFASENPDIDLSPYFKESASRVFRVTEIKNKGA